MRSSSATSAVVSIAKCICGCRLTPEEAKRQPPVCDSCTGRPEAKRLGQRPPENIRAGARDFTPAERAMIARMAPILPEKSLLELLNERLVSDLGPDAAPYTLEQLRAAAPAKPASAQASDWVELRRLLARARRTGLLDQITPQMIEDFAVVYSLTAGQLMRIKDAIQSEGDR